MEILFGTLLLAVSGLWIGSQLGKILILQNELNNYLTMPHRIQTIQNFRRSDRGKELLSGTPNWWIDKHDEDFTKYLLVEKEMLAIEKIMLGGVQ